MGDNWGCSSEQSEQYVYDVCTEALDGTDYVVSNSEGEIIAQGEE